MSGHVLTATAFYRHIDGVRVRFSRGDTLTGLSAAEVKRLTEAGAIAPAGSLAAEAAHLPDPPAIVPIVEPGDGSTPDGADGAGGGDAEPTGTLERPKRTEPVDTWRAWAKDAGYDPEQVDALTKKELQDLE